MPIADIGRILAFTRQIGGDQIETAVAKAWLAAHVNEYDRVEFNVKLGPGIDIGAAYVDYIRKAAYANSRLRADIVAWRGDVPTIVEVKDRLYPSVLGQLLTYWQLMREDNPKLLNVYKQCAARTIQPGMPKVLEQNGITFELYPGVQVANIE